MTTLTTNRKPDRIDLIILAILAFIGMCILVYGCSEPEQARPEYFRIDTDYRYHRYKDEAGQWVDVYDTCYYLHPYVSGRYCHNSKEIHSWCSNPVTGETYHIMCDGRIGDTVSVDMKNPIPDGVMDFQIVVQ